ncbi:kinase-like domain-containing protein [Chiua virens]|nr:kinase-like domain-containing protein [Chiua virens]
MNTTHSSPTKRSASPPLDTRPSKRTLTSSPEEGELDDPDSTSQELTHGPSSPAQTRARLSASHPTTENRHSNTTGRPTMTIASKSPSFVTSVPKTFLHVAAWPTAGSLTSVAGSETANVTGGHHGTRATENGTDTRTTAAAPTDLRLRIPRCHHIHTVARETDIQKDLLTEIFPVTSHAPRPSLNHIVLALPSRNHNPCHVPCHRLRRISIASTGYPPVDHPSPHSPPCRGTFGQTECALNPGIVTNGGTIPIGASLLSRTARRGGVSHELSHPEVEYRPVSPSPVSPRRTPPPPLSPVHPAPLSEESIEEVSMQCPLLSSVLTHHATTILHLRCLYHLQETEDVQRAREKRAAVSGVDQSGGHGSEGDSFAVTAGKKKRQLVERSRKEEMEAYGRTFEGCGKQLDYNCHDKVVSWPSSVAFAILVKSTRQSKFATGRAVALKRILMHNEKEGVPVTALREIKILKAMKHPCIVDIVDMFVVRSKGKESPLSVYMVFPYMDHDLAGLLENDRVKLQPSHIKLYMKQLLEGTEYMHRNHILHRDMKAANLLISNTGSLRIADFGLARAFDPSIEKRYTNCVVTRWYRPPELLLGARQYGGEVDIWGIGCVLGEMFMRKPILPGTSDIDQLEKIWQLCGTPNQHTWPNFDALPGCEGVKRFQNYPKKLKSSLVSISIGPETSDLLDKLLTCNPRDRITASQALDHDYFWTDPLPADPKSLPVYEASHEFDKRGRRNNIPPQHPPPDHVRPALQHGQGFYGHPPPGPHGHGRPRGGVPPPPVMLTALMQQAQGGPPGRAYPWAAGTVPRLQAHTVTSLLLGCHP